MWFEMQEAPVIFADQAPHKFVNKTVLEASPEEVFAIWADIDQWPLWFEDIQRGEWITEGGPGVGSERIVHLSDLSVHEKILEWTPGKRFAFSITKATLPLSHRIVEDYRLEPTGDGHSRLKWTVGYDLRWFVKPVSPIVKKKFGSMFVRATASMVEYVRASQQD